MCTITILPGGRRRVCVNIQPCWLSHRRTRMACSFDIFLACGFKVTSRVQNFLDAGWLPRCQGREKPINIPDELRVVILDFVEEIYH